MPVPKKPVDLMAYAEKLGFKVPPELVGVATQIQYKKEGILEIWKCGKCNKKLESEIKLMEAYCGDCDKDMRLAWSGKP